MARTTNYSVLKKYLPTESFDENYALISHYIQLQGTDKAKKYEQEILSKNINLNLLPQKNRQICFFWFRAQALRFSPRAETAFS